MAVHTDDADYVHEEDWMKTEIFNGVNVRFGAKEGDIQNQLGLTRTMNESGTAITITMTGFVEALYGEWGSHTSKLMPKTPFPPGKFLEKVKDEDADPVLSAKLIKQGYPKIVGSLLWASRMCYPECAVGCNYLARQMSAPTQEAWDCALYMVKYLYSRKDEGIRFSKQGDKNRLMAMYDASNKGDYTDGCAIGGHVIFLSGGPLEWTATKLPKNQPGTSLPKNQPGTSQA